MYKLFIFVLCINYSFLSIKYSWMVEVQYWIVELYSVRQKFKVKMFIKFPCTYTYMYSLCPNVYVSSSFI